MNRLFLSLALASFLGPVSAFAQAQTQTPPPPPPQHAEENGGFSLQVIGGPLFLRLPSNPGLAVNNQAGFLVGLSMGGNRGGRVGIGADVLYGKKKAELVGFGDLDQSVVHVPVMLKVNIGSKNRNGLSFLALGGGYFDWQFSGKVASVDISNDTNGYQVGYVLGGGVEIARVTVQARYMAAVKEIDKTFNLSKAVNSDTKSFAILFGFRLN